jgi:hypothetical protein
VAYLEQQQLQPGSGKRRACSGAWIFQPKDVFVAYLFGQFGHDHFQIFLFQPDQDKSLIRKGIIQAIASKADSHRHANRIGYVNDSG